MAARGQRIPAEPVYTRLGVQSRRGANKDLSRISLDELRGICASHGLSQSGTRASLRQDLDFYLSMDWGRETEKVAVSALRGVQGPRSILRRVEHSPPAFFDELFTQEMWNHIVTETNRYSSERVREG